MKLRIRDVFEEVVYVIIDTKSRNIAEVIAAVILLIGACAYDDAIKYENSKINEVKKVIDNPNELDLTFIENYDESCQYIEREVIYNDEANQNISIKVKDYNGVVLAYYIAVITNDSITYITIFDNLKDTVKFGDDKTSSKIKTYTYK